MHGTLIPIHHSFRIWNFNSAIVPFDLKNVQNCIWKSPCFSLWDMTDSSCFIHFHHRGPLSTIRFASMSASKSSLFLGIQIFQYSRYPITQKSTWNSFSQTIGIGSSIFFSRFFLTLLIFAVHKNKITHAFFWKIRSFCNATYSKEFQLFKAAVN